MNNPIILNSIRFITLITIQVLICNNILFLGFINPYPYILFILLFNINTEEWKLILASFFLGLTLDFFSNSGGANAAASLVLAYFRPVILRSCFGLNYIHQNLKLNTVEFSKLALYIILCTLLHHSILFALEVFDFQHFEYILVQILSSVVFTTVVILISFSLFFSRKS